MSLSTNIADLATRVATEAKALRTLINNNAIDLSGLTTSAKSNLVAAINELQAEINNIDAGGAIDDDVTGPHTTWSSSKVSGEITGAINDLVNGAPGALDTLEELAAAIGDDADFAGTVTTALGNRVRVDAAQSFTAPQQSQGRDNIGAASAAAVGDTETNFVAIFEAGL